MKTVIAICIVILGLLAYHSYAYKSVEHCSNVVEIGGCNQYTCGVRLANGERTSLSKPMIGDEHCYYETVAR